MADLQKCPHCSKQFRDRNSVYQHIKAKHDGKGRSAFRPEHEPSMAELSIEAEQLRDSGQPVPSDIAWLLS